MTANSTADSVSAGTDMPVLRAERLSCHFTTRESWPARLLGLRRRRVVKAVDEVSFTIARGKTLGLVGESGCGKSTLARCLAGLVAPSGGEFFFGGRSVASQKGSVQMIFQDPYSSLNPKWRVGRTVGDPLLALGLVSTKAEMGRAVVKLLQDVGLAASDALLYPHEFSGGQRQRVAIARALASRPALLICDEPTSALDVSVQAQILNLMRHLQKERALTCLFISHNLSVVDHMADDVAVMYFGSIVELRDKHTFFSRPLHPYSRLLIETAPDVRTIGKVPAPPEGEVPSPFNSPAGCAFHPRCPRAVDRCRQQRPLLRPLRDGGFVACHVVGGDALND